ncbi:unnamed protein product [Clavelina lepadiformis]|uniref:Uncharacterized protein n=1 Tax=Clavelina lepadiformis TaxID=159417 RepID=A0ABP0FPV6_CLALP
MNLTRKEAYKTLGVPEGTSMDEVKRAYTSIALANHPNQKHSNPATTMVFQEASFAYKRLLQKPNEDFVSLINMLETFQSVFRFRMKTENGYVYFMYNPYTGLPDSDDETSSNRPKRLYRKHTHKGDAFRWNGDTRNFEDVDSDELREMEEKAEKNADELINEEDRAKKKAAKRRQKKLRQREKKRLAKEAQVDVDEEEDREEYAIKLLKDHQQKLLNQDIFMNGKKISNSGKSTTLIHQQSFLPKSASDNSKYRDKDANNRNQAKTYNKEKKSHLNDKINSESGSEEGKSSDSEEPGWDEGSAFFSTAIKNTRTKSKPANKTSPQTEKTSVDIKSAPEQKSEEILSQSRHLALIGSKKAGTGDYSEAVILFTKAISLLNTDCRYFGNRSYCYDRLELYDRALEDANTAISLSSGWPKGYFRKGRALAGLKRYIEAERAFEDVLKIDKQCADAEQELHAVRMRHLLDMGFARELCEVALRKKTTIRGALDELLSGVLAETSLQDVYISDEEDAELFEAELNKELGESKVDEDKKENCDNVDFNSLWIGNMTKRVTEDALVQYFSRFGEVCGVTTMYVRKCAFVNFTASGAARMALEAGETVKICDTLLVIRYPDRAYEQCTSAQNYAAKFQQRECYYWRNQGCHFGSACRFIHVPAHKGIELQRVERTPYRSVMEDI